MSCAGQLVNAILQMYLLDTVLGHQFFSLGSGPPFFPPAQFRISIRSGFYQQMVITRIVRYSVAEPNLFDLAPAPTFKKFPLRLPLRLRLELLWVPVFIVFK
jgi:hypothetical protein